MTKHVPFSLWIGILSVALLLAAGWAYWREQPSSDLWIVQQPEHVVSEAAAGKELHVAFVLRNTASQPRRILGVEACRGAAVSFGSKLDALPVVPPGGEITAILMFIPRDEDFKQDATIYVEEAAGIRMLKITARSPSHEPAS